LRGSLADGSAVRLIASDLDGTLLDGHGRLSERTVAALRAADGAGIAVVAATGRSHRTAGPRLEPAGVIRTAVCSNGASVYDLTAGRVVRRRPVQDSAVAVLVRTLRAVQPRACFGWETAAGFGWERPFLTLAPADVRADLESGRRRGEVHDDIETARPQSLTKLLVGHPDVHSNEWLAVLTPALPPAVQASTSGALFVEVTGEGVDKASTLSLVCADLGIDRSEVVAFGDQANDVAMLEWAGRSWAPANAHPAARAGADALAGHPRKDGVAAVIEGLVG
jgi:hypothetical protein